MNPRPPDCQVLPAIIEIAEAAGQRILDIYEGEFEAVAKSDGSPLTAADEAANRLISRRLAELTPQIPILSEESAQAEYAQRRVWERFWLVDPLDGTREFVKRNGEFTVNIALISGHRPVLGVVHVPVSGATYYACGDEGAFRQGSGAAPAPIHVAPYAGGAARVVASRSHPGEHLRVFLDRLARREGDFQTLAMGSSLKFCLVAEGKADIYPRLGPTREWDTAAAQCIVEGAGGQVRALDGRPLEYNKPSILNPWFLVSGEGRYDWRDLVPDTSS